jgi:hypothetical protein
MIILILKKKYYKQKIYKLYVKNIPYILFEQLINIIDTIPTHL